MDYGSSDEKYFTESDRFNPSSPYSASKASAELICSSFANTYGYESLIVRPSNNYGTYQQPEKLIPFSISNLLEGKNVELYGDGKNIRHWLHVEEQFIQYCIYWKTILIMEYLILDQRIF